MYWSNGGSGWGPPFGGELVISPTPVPDPLHRRRSRTASLTFPVVFATVPPRVFGHALVVVMCLVVAYAGRTNRLSDQIGFLQLQPDSRRPASLSGVVGPTVT